MTVLKQIGGSSVLFLMTFVSAIFTPVALAGPKLLFYYEYFQLSTSDCVTRGYQVLGERALQTPNDIEREGSAFFAIGENHSTTVIIDCSDVAQSGRVSVMATSNDPAFRMSYLRNILNSLKRFAR